MIDTSNVAPSSTSMSFLPRTSTTAWVVKPRVVTQEPTMGTTNPSSKRPQQAEARTEPQEPTPARDVEPQEPVLPHEGAKDEEHYEANILKDTKTMLKDFAQSVLATTSQVQNPQAVMMSAKRYATWVFNALT